jgi:hypothetical protein
MLTDLAENFARMSVMVKLERGSWTAWCWELGRIVARSEKSTPHLQRAVGKW